MVKEILYWLGFSGIASCSLASITTWVVYFLHIKFNIVNKDHPISNLTIKFLNRLFFALWVLFFIAMAVDFKLLGPF